MAARQLIKSFCSAIPLIAALCFSTAEAQVPSSLSYFGEITKPDGTPLESSSVQMNIQILSPGAEACVLFEEQQTLDMTGSGGRFDLAIGKGTRSGSDSGLTLAQVFSNSGTRTSPSCAVGNSYTPAAGDTRKIRVSFNDGSGLVTMSPDQTIHSVPYAQVAQSSDSLGGLTKTGFVQVNNATAAVTQANLESVFNNSASVTELQALIAGTSAKYTTANPTATVSFNSQRLSNLANPTSAQDAATKNYCDANVGAKAADMTGVGSGVGNGKVLTWNATTNRWEAQTASASDATKLPLAGGTMAGAIAMGGYDITNAGFITQGAGKYLGLGSYTNTSESALVSGTLTPGGATYKGVTWFNTDTSQIKYWDGASAVPVSTGAGGGSVTNVTATSPLVVATGSTTPALSINFGIGLTTISNNLVVDFAPSGAFGAVTGTGKVVADDHYRLNPPTVAGDAYKLVRVNPSGSGYELRTPTDVRADLALGSAAMMGVGTTAGTVAAGDDPRITNAFPMTGGALTGSLYLASGNSSMAPLHIPSGGLKSAPAVGDFESDGTNLYFTDNSAIRNKLVLYAGSPTSQQALIWNGTIWAPGNVASPIAASPSNDGLVSMTTQTFAGNKTFNQSVYVMGQLGVGTSTPANGAALEVLGTGPGASSILIPRDTTANRPSTAQNGMMRYNTTNNKFEVFESGAWTNMISSASGALNGITDVSNSGSINLTPGVGNSVIVNQTTASTSPANGALVVNGGAGIGGTLNVFGNVMSNGSIKTSPITAATAGANQPSPSVLLGANYWNGSGSAVDTWSITNQLGSGMNPASTLAFSHTGSPGAAAVSFMNGNVGIGVTTPNAKLTVDNNGGPSFPGLIVRGASGQSAPLQQWIDSTNSVIASIDAFGTMSIGNSIVGWDTNISGPAFSSTATNYITSGFSNGVPYNIVLQPSAGGKVGIGTTAPSDMLQVQGDIRVGTSGSNGCIKGFSGTALAGTCSSDMRFKKEIKPLAPLGERLSRLQPATYKWRTDEFPERNFTSEEDLGLIAQQVKTVMPELVEQDSDGYYRVRYSRLPIYTLQAVRESYQNMKTLEAENRKLKSDLDQLKQRLDRLEKALSR